MNLALRTDSPIAEIYVINGEQTQTFTHDLGRSMAQALPGFIDSAIGASYDALRAVIVYAGPGSFTGLRISHTIANSLAYSLNIPIVSTSGKDWVKEGITLLQSGKNIYIAQPEYGAEAHITPQKK